jgi:MFS family permease
MLGVAPLNIVLESYLVRLVPDSFSGRVSAVNRFGALSLQWCGPLLAGVVADQFGPPGGAIALMLMLVPLALALHVSRSLGVLEQPVERVAELNVAPARQTVAS